MHWVAAMHCAADMLQHTLINGLSDDHHQFTKIMHRCARACARPGMRGRDVIRWSKRKRKLRSRIVECINLGVITVIISLITFFYARHSPQITVDRYFMFQVRQGIGAHQRCFSLWLSVVYFKANAERMGCLVACQFCVWWKKPVAAGVVSEWNAQSRLRPTQRCSNIENSFEEIRRATKCTCGKKCTPQTVKGEERERMKTKSAGRSICSMCKWMDRSILETRDRSYVFCLTFRSRYVFHEQTMRLPFDRLAICPCAYWHSRMRVFVRVIAHVRREENDLIVLCDATQNRA